jgi:hypothetical protein
MRCKTCQYPLANLTERRCPECGRAFDPANPRTWSLPGDGRHRRLRWGLLVMHIVIVLFVIAAAIPLLQNYPIL